jgi:hypothetical protein
MSVIGVKALSGRAAVMLAAGTVLGMIGVGVRASAAARARVLAPPGACVLDDTSFQTADGGCKDLATWLVYSARHGQNTWDGA